MANFLRISVLFLYAILINYGSYGQLSQPGIPPSFFLFLPKSDLPIKRMQEIDIDRLIREDMIFDTIKDIPWRFGENLDVSINPANSGRWDVLSNGDRIWRTEIWSPGAYTINLTFDEYYMPEGAELYIYNHERSMVLGAFTELNNQEDGYFATTLIDGDRIVVEYYEPKDVAFKGKLKISTVTHAYRNPYKYVKAFGDSGYCHLNVACDEANGWDDQVNAVVMMISGGNAFCSGTIINNTNFDKEPYLLTANHCYRLASTLVFWFNWQSETCVNPTTSPPYNSLSGATHIARYNASDFWLLRLNQPIPDEFNVFYAGWNRTLASELTDTIIAIHHPRGDIKKFSFSETGVRAAAYLGAPGSGTTHWHIVWSGGTTTESGSSGSAIFDSKGQIIGALHGGSANCGNTLPDWYGRFGVSWTGGGSPTSRLKDWLDPGESGLMNLNGYNPRIALVEDPANFGFLKRTPKDWF
jgi:lysyl endopeptidase